LARQTTSKGWELGRCTIKRQFGNIDAYNLMKEIRLFDEPFNDKDVYEWVSERERAVETAKITGAY